MVQLKPKRLLSIGAVLLLSFATFADAARRGVKVEPTPEAVEAEVAVAAKKGSALMGKMLPILGKLFVRKEDLPFSFSQVLRAVREVVDGREFVIISTVAWGLVPITGSIYDIVANVTESRQTSGDDEGAEEDVVDAAKKSKFRKAYEAIGGGATGTGELVATEPKRTMKPFRETKIFQVVDHISQASKIGFSVIIVDCVSLISRMMGYNPWNIMERSSKVVSKVLVTGWITLRLQTWKRYFLEKSFGKSEDSSDLGKLKVIDNLVDGVFYVIWAFHLLNYLEVQTGVAVKSLFSLGATGTLVFGLASKDIATQVISGITLHLSDKMFEGDDVRFSDGTSGKIEKMGWFETMIRNSDELVVGIPNTELSGKRIYNLSRTRRSQVKQELRVSYDDAAKIPKLLDSIKEEIKKDCPKLITDGSRPFRANWRGYEVDHLQVVVDCHFTIKPTGNEYWENRQTMLEAINRAAEKSGVQFYGPVRAARV